MKGITLSILIFSFMFIAGCSKSGSGTGGGTGGGGTGGTNPFVPNCSGAGVSFAGNVSPIFQTVCTQSGCHNAGSVNGPGPLTTYAQISAAKVQIRAAILSGLMPQNTTLTAAQKNSIICWIDAGAGNN